MNSLAGLLMYHLTKNNLLQQPISPKNPLIRNVITNNTGFTLESKPNHRSKDLNKKNSQKKSQKNQSRITLKEV